MFFKKFLARCGKSPVCSAFGFEAFTTLTTEIFKTLYGSGSDPGLPSAEWVQLAGKLSPKRKTQALVPFPFHAVTKNTLIQPFTRLAISTYSAFAMFLIIYGFLFLLNCFSLRFWLKFMWLQHTMLFTKALSVLPMSAFLMSFLH